MPPPAPATAIFRCLEPAFRTDQIAATVAEKAIEYLEGPVVRVGGFDTPFPYSLEHLYMPDPRRVLAGIEKTFTW